MITYLFPLFVVKLFVMCDSSCKLIKYHVRKCSGKCVKFSIFNPSILLKAVRNHFYFSFSHRIEFFRGWGRGVLQMSSDFGSVIFVQVTYDKYITLKLEKYQVWYKV